MAKEFFWAQALDNLSDDIIFEGQNAVPTTNVGRRKEIINLISDFGSGKNLEPVSPGLSALTKGDQILIEVDLDSEDNAGRTVSVLVLTSRRQDTKKIETSFRNFLMSTELMLSETNLNIVFGYLKKKERSEQKSATALQIFIILLLVFCLSLIAWFMTSQKG